MDRGAKSYHWRAYYRFLKSEILYMTQSLYPQESDSKPIGSCRCQSQLKIRVFFFFSFFLLNFVGERQRRMAHISNSTNMNNIVLLLSNCRKKVQRQKAQLLSFSSNSMCILSTCCHKSWKIMTYQILRAIKNS